MDNQATYTAVQAQAKVPWPVVAVLHFREANQRLDRHLHNGDPLIARTVHVPIGRPVGGQPPFTWVESAIDALSTAWKPPTWSIGNSLQFLERYNGLGYQMRGVNTPYLWDYTDKYTGGLFISDGTIDPDKREMRPGCASLFKVFEQKGISLDFTWLD